ncbi:MAG: hypothetical protein ABJO57_10080 [Lentilitoribacter sp.]
MNQREFLQDLRSRSPNDERYEIEVRAYKNAKGVDQLIYLQRGYWRYVAWAEKNTDINFAEWVVHCDQNPSEGFSLSHLLMYWLWTDHCNRYRASDPTPDSYPPMGYEGWAEEYHSKTE